jgi:hypothetical protein
VYIWMVTVQNFTTGEAMITWLLWRYLRIRSASAEERLSQTLSHQALTYMRGTGKEIGMPHLLCRQCAAQNINHMLVTHNIPARCLYLLGCHGSILAEIHEKGKMKRDRVKRLNIKPL